MNERMTHLCGPQADGKICTRDCVQTVTGTGDTCQCSLLGRDRIGSPFCTDRSLHEEDPFVSWYARYRIANRTLGSVVA